MNPDTAQLEVRGGGIYTDFSGDESYFCVRLVWTMTAEHTLRFLLYLAGEEAPLVCVISPGDRNTVAASTVGAFQHLIGLVP